MLSKTTAIVLHALPYGESSLIVRLYTRQYGAISIMVKGIRSSKGRQRMAWFQPLHLIEIELYHKKRVDALHLVKETRCPEPFSHIPFHPVKSALAIFLGHFLQDSLKEDGPQEALFDFVYHSVLALDHLEEGLGNFHLQFILRYFEFQGYGLSEHPEWQMEANNPERFEILRQLYEEPYGSTCQMSTLLRQTLLDDLLKHHEWHGGTAAVKNTADMLREIWK